MFVTQGNQYPTINACRNISGNKFMAFNSHKWNLSGLQYNQGVHARDNVLAIPSWYVNKNKSFISLYDYNYNLKQIITFDEFFEMEDVTVGSDFIFFTTSSGALYRVPYSMSGSININQFAFNEKSVLYTLDRTLATAVHPAYSSSIDITTEVPLNSFDTFTGSRNNGKLTVRISFLAMEFETYLENFSPVVSNNNIWFNISCLKKEGSGNTHIYAARLHYTYNASTKKLALDTSGSQLFDYIINTNTIMAYTVTEALALTAAFNPIDNAIEIIFVEWEPRMNGYNLASGGGTYTL